MAVTRVNQGEIVEVPFEMPDGSILPHPALVLSKEYLQDYEDGLFYAVLISTKNHYPEFTIPIKDSWLNKPLKKESFFVTHIIDQFNVDEVISRNNTYLKAYYFDYVVDEIIKNVIGGEDDCSDECEGRDILT